MRALVAAAVVVAAFGGVTACTPHPVGPARSYDTFEGKATTTAESALSVVETVRLAAEASTQGNAFGPYLSVVVSDAEESLNGLAGTFGSIQPPDEESDRLYDELDSLLDDASTHVRDIRLSVRRGDLDDLASRAEPLADDADDLRSFVTEHG
jgi:hypothetical protein